MSDTYERGRTRLTNVEKVIYRCVCGHDHTEYIDQPETTRVRVKTVYCAECGDDTEHRLDIIFHELRPGNVRSLHTGSSREDSA